MHEMPEVKSQISNPKSQINSNIQIIFEDDNLVVINKPYGMVVNNAESVKGETVQDWFKNKLSVISDQLSVDSEFLQKGGVVHRLDKDTSGVMILAKNEESYEKLKLQFLERKTQKTYLALVHGEMPQETGIITNPIDRHPKDRKKFAVSDNPARTAITEWRVVQKLEISISSNRNLKFELLELSPHTGRTHQLRVHMQHLHHPIVSDPIYGLKKSLKDDLKICSRLFLHAKSLELISPTTGEKVKFEAPLPRQLQAVLH